MPRVLRLLHARDARGADGARAARAARAALLLVLRAGAGAPGRLEEVRHRGGLLHVDPHDLLLPVVLLKAHKFRRKQLVLDVGFLTKPTRHVHTDEMP